MKILTNLLTALNYSRYLYTCRCI